MRALARLRRDLRGVTVVEFGFVAPIALMMIFGLMEVAFQAYVQATLDGAVNAAARRATVESNATDQTVLDAEVRDQVRTIAARADVTFDRKNYVSVSDIGIEEEYRDKTPLNGHYDLGECFIDYNGSGYWEGDRGRSGQGGADDFTRYKVTASYPRFFPMGLLGMPQTANVSSVSVLRNQPYAGQGGAGSTWTCP